MSGIKDEAQKIGNTTGEKLDQYYNKLPLDTINEKSGGKVNVKSKNFKLAVLGVAVIIIVTAVAIIFSCCSAPVLKGTEPQHHMEFFNALDEDQQKEFLILLAINPKLDDYVGKTYEEIKNERFASFNDRERELLEKAINEINDVSDSDFLQLKQHYFDEMERASSRRKK